MQEKFDVTGMTCAACAGNVERSVKKISGVESAEVNLLLNSLSVDYDSNRANPQMIIQAVVHAGYGASLHGEALGNEKTTVSLIEDEIAAIYYRLIWSIPFWLIILYVAMGHMLGWPLPSWMHQVENAAAFAFLQFLLVVPIVYLNRIFFQSGFKAMHRLAPNMDSLVALGSTAALIYGIYVIFQLDFALGKADWTAAAELSANLYFESAATILTLITVGKYLEAKSKGKTSEALVKLMNLTPQSALVIRDGKEQMIPIAEVKAGDVVVIKPGQAIPVDGMVLKGTSSVDQAALTGESLPVEKNPGDRVQAGMINQTGSFQMRAEKVGEGTVLAQMIHLVEEASASKAPIAKLADRISTVFVPTVLVIAVLAAAGWMLGGAGIKFALSIAISVLVISCPCALGLATPVAIMVGTGRGAEQGILIKSAEVFEIAHKVDAVVLDKTGTITEGKPVVTDLLPVNGVEASKLLQIAASLEKWSEHPLAEAILKQAEAEQIDFIMPKSFSSVTGKGVTGIIEGMECALGNQSLMMTEGVELKEWQMVADQLAEDGKTVVYVAENHKLLGIISVFDPIKSSSFSAVKVMQAMGMKVVLLSGDHEKTAQAVGRRLHINQVRAGVMPADKVEEIRRLQALGNTVAMIGDGINDAPALAVADVGMAIGAGTDIAMEAADIVLMKSDLNDVAAAIQLSRLVLRNIKQNLFWAFFYNVLGIPLAAGVLYPLTGIKLTPMIAAAAMSFSSVFVVLNALRLKRFQPIKQNRSEEIFHTQHFINQKEERKIRMKKMIQVNGMSCAHCQARVEKVLAGLDGVESAQVDLQEKNVMVVLNKPIEDQILWQAVEEAGYEPVTVQDI